ncbi:MAG: hypothetical protein KGJ80_16245 [Chloroflexota bacterium]|nr:hypothetical protein [Chloroflexota bacterium]
MQNESKVVLDQAVRRYIYDQVMKVGVPPTIAQAAIALSTTRADMQALFQQLADAHMLVLQKDTGEVLMANPFSAVPTPFLAQVGERSYFGNCIWDVMGIPAMLHQDAIIRASCGDCGTAMTLRITNGSLEPIEGIAHFAIPAAHWWDDIVFN